MEKGGQIIKVTEPTEWVNSMHLVVAGAKLRICIDPQALNKALLRENYPIPTIEEVVSQLGQNAQIFSVLDATAGYLQIGLEYESSLLTTFNTPLGRYRWLKLPFGIKSAPELFQRMMDEMLEGIDQARAIMDDILIAAPNKVEHDRILKAVLRRAADWNLKLNLKKCQIGKDEVKYVGHVVSSEGLKVDPEKVGAVKEALVDIEGVRRLLGFTQYLAKFIPHLSEVDKPLRDLLKSDAAFQWEAQQEASFQKLKDLACSSPVLAHYDPRKKHVIQCDASTFAVGGVFLQDEEHPVANTSRALTKKQQNWAQIEKELFSIVHCCEKFRYYIF